mmetsp:Transcript_28199/g.73932  ORF Transcript_28199/g.73932 Transcript_28199/m.73932 type:complete len:125 (-) Transcript_28199:158-532(-)|eukprot:CAMPEP_0182928782 /NCGR_PEP_ID=MMETSP0105_2-20130417/17451_1 /TAXON_ID=81532 ORGANISM="Acanthoeca-like sp., Strain 10tr" /NCGR_SAMPLE_ID=MMETSP0105_2 /ASSEMBLY_ACC=CAM_ASM_000205 /LENGTH=124 /DNA_ID=CAMNT_0025066825 /DNA_START=115 /DNA_END=489 /DNA_ORIENTATION=+
MGDLKIKIGKPLQALIRHDSEGRILPDPTLIQTLRPGHKIARGRGRKKQLETMTELEKLAENAAKMEKMRISARECRLRKKNRTRAIEDEVKRYEDAEVQNVKEINLLEERITALQGLIATASQ